SGCWRPQAQAAINRASYGRVGLRPDRGSDGAEPSRNPANSDVGYTPRLRPGASDVPMPIDLRYRQIHLDFHTGPWIPDVGADFDAREFARTMKRANVDSVTVFAKCHHGHLYYNTNRPERHPGLRKGLDLLAGQVEALHR